MSAPRGYATTYRQHVTQHPRASVEGTQPTPRGGSVMPTTTNRYGRLARLTGLTTILVSVLLAAAAGGATAAAAATTPRSTITTVTAMHVIGFDKTVAQANGYEIKTAGDGKEYAVAAGDVSPANVVSGNCGFSYVYEYGIGNRAIELYTGFSVVRGAVDYSWRVQLDD